MKMIFLMSNCWALTITITFFWQTVDALKITSLDVPRTASHQTQIDCRYDLEGETLYDVKWYKDDKQFFRCSGDGTVQQYPVDGVSLYHSNSATIGSCPLELTGLTSNSGGEYKCEVSLEKPSFLTISKTSTLKIIQYSKHTQLENDNNNNNENSKEINTENIKSSSQNQSALNDGTKKWIISQYICLIICIIISSL